MTPLNITYNIMQEIYKDLLLFDKNLLDNTNEFFSFFQVWKKSDVYLIDCGYVRFEPYYNLRAATVHGMFHKTPFKHLQLINSMLYLYLEDHPGIDVLECQVPKSMIGVNHLVKGFAGEPVKLKDGLLIYNIRR